MAAIGTLIPPPVADTTQYSLRKNSDLRNVAVRTTVSQKSCIPSLIRLWNGINDNIRNIDSISSFKKQFRIDLHLLLSPPYYFKGNRFLSDLHARSGTNAVD